MSDDLDIQLAGEVTWRNYSRLGYERLTRGVYGRAPQLDGLDRWEVRRVKFLSHVRAVMTAYQGRDVVLYGPTAMQILGVALPARLQDWDTCHILVLRGSYRPLRQGVCAHWTTEPWDVWDLRDGIPVLHPVDHWLQLTGTDDELIEVADGLMRRHHPLISLDEFHRRLDALAGRPGVQRGRRLMKWVVPGTDSLYETRTRLVLVRAGLPVPAVNLPVRCYNGFTYHVDMGYEVEKVAVEFDGQVHVGDKRQMEIDAARRNDIQGEGWFMITVTAQMLEHPVDLVRTVEAALVMRRAALASKLS